MGGIQNLCAAGHTGLAHTVKGEKREPDVTLEDAKNTLGVAIKMEESAYKK